MNRWIFLFLSLWSACFALANTYSGDKGSMVEPDSSIRSIFEDLFHKKMIKHQLNLNMHLAGTYTPMASEGQPQFHFEARTVRLQFQGNINDFMSYDYTQRLTQSLNSKGMMDGLGLGIDVLKLRFKLTPSLDLSVGKLIAAYGGVSFNYNPIYVTQFDDIENHITCFLPGMELLYRPNKRNIFVFQILNAANKKFDERYRGIFDEYTSPRLPIGFHLYWEGNILPKKNQWKTFYSINFTNQARLKKGSKESKVLDGNMVSYFVGNEFEFSSDFRMYFDLLFSHQALDESGILTPLISPTATVQNVNYGVLQSRVEYSLNQNWNLFAMGIYNYAGLYQKGYGLSEGLVREHIQALGGAELSVKRFKGVRFYFCGLFDHEEMKQLRKRNNDFSLRMGIMYRLPIW